jgi:hypothetical protein
VHVERGRRTFTCDRRASHKISKRPRLYINHVSTLSVLAASNSVALRVAALGNDTQRVLVELGQRNWVWVHCRLGTVKYEKLN